MMRRSLYHVQFYFTRVDLNTPKGKLANQKSILKYVQWYTRSGNGGIRTLLRWILWASPTRGPATTASPAAPICAYCKKLGVEELMPLLCELDEVMIALQHGVLHREQTIASGGPYCDYFITGDRHADTVNGKDGK